MKHTIGHALLILLAVACLVPAAAEAVSPPGGGYDPCLVCWRYGVPTACRECLERIYWDGCHPGDPMCY